MGRNADGNLTIETTMGEVRRYQTWQDELDTSDGVSVVVCEDGSVSCATTGDRIEEGGFMCHEDEKEWKEYWRFQDSDELNGRR